MPHYHNRVMAVLAVSFLHVLYVCAWRNGDASVTLSFQNPHWEPEEVVVMHAESHLNDTIFEAFNVYNGAPMANSLIAASVNNSGYEHPMRYGGCDVHGARGLIGKIFKEHNVYRAGMGMEGTPRWDLLYPCSHGNHRGIENSLKNLQIVRNRPRAIFAVDGETTLHYKDEYWAMLEKKYGRDIAATIMPETFLASSENDMKLLKEVYRQGDQFLLKKNVEQKKGLKIVPPEQGLEEVLTQSKDYPIIQRLITDVHKINGHKLNIRAFLMLLCDPVRTNSTEDASVQQTRYL
mmetsp:Transcript_5565/g.11026  ORF Transcript_5565/g.11026 Transcript_5565/m.11026 type:complete len:292 (-) Transcript_5565:2110-2985(-)